MSQSIEIDYPSTFDYRRMSVTVQIGSQLKTYSEPFWIRAKGCKYANKLQNECTVEIANMNADTRNYLLTETSPFNNVKVGKTLSLYAGRVSTGLFLVYTGNIQTSQIKQPPDIILTLKCGTAHNMKGKSGRRSGGKHSKISVLAGGIAANLGLSLNMQAEDKAVSNYAYSGNALDEVGALQSLGVDAFVDDNHLVVKTPGKALSGTALVVNETTGMVGIPEVTEQGLKVKFLYVGNISIGYALQVTSILNPAVNGLFVIYKLNYDLATRENEWYYMAECLKAKQ